MRPMAGCTGEDRGGGPGSTAVTDVFAALGDPTRTAIVSRLAADGRGTATSLTGIADISRQAVDRHLRVLAGAGLVESRREGREVVYSLKAETVERSAAWLDELGRAWEQRLLTLKAEAEGGEARQGSAATGDVRP